MRRERLEWNSRGRACSVGAFAMDAPDDVPRHMLMSLAAMPECEQAELLRAAIGAAMKQMSIYRVLDLRQRLLAEFDCDNPTVRSTLEMIDGQIALREISGGAGWR